jgi:hypothetical protein
MNVQTERKLILAATILTGLIGFGSVFAYYVGSMTSTVTIQEPLTYSVDPTTATIFPGQSQTLTITIDNAAPLNYGTLIQKTLTKSGPDVICSLSYSSVTGAITDKRDGNDANGDEFNIGSSGSGTILYTLSSPKDSAPGTCTTTFGLNRGNTYP